MLLLIAKIVDSGYALLLHKNTKFTAIFFLLQGPNCIKTVIYGQKFGDT